MNEWNSIFNSIHIKKESVQTTATNVIDFFETYSKEMYSFFWMQSDKKSIVARMPSLFVVADHGKKSIVKTSGNESSWELDPIRILQFINDEISEKCHSQNIDTDFFSSHLGFLGYLGYEAGAYFEAKLSSQRQKIYGMPDLCFALFNEYYIIDTKDKNKLSITKFEIEYRDAKTNKLEAISSSFSNYFNTYIRSSLSYTKFPFIQSHIKKEEYAENFEKIKQWIQEGEIYQANYTQVFSAKYNDSSFAFFKKLSATQTGPYFMYWKFLNISIISTSPESFIELKNNKISAMPIKGSLAKNSTLGIDEFKLSSKEQSELNMIVDLFRNDFNKICQQQSVKVVKHQEVLDLPNLYHTYSLIEGQLAEGKNLYDVLAACFPSGSITGCPKIRAVNLLASIEPYRRSLYTGSMGYIAKNEMNLNVSIRSILHQGDRLYFQVGGGIVFDSDVEAEYEECFIKAKAFIDAVSTSKD